MADPRYPWEGPLQFHNSGVAVYSWEGHTTTGGNRILGSREAIAWNEWCWQESDGAHRVIQSAWNTSVPVSAGTHDFDRVYDCSMTDRDWPQMQRFYRSHGAFAWWRKATPGLWPDHIHLGLLGMNTKVGVFIPGQIADYLANPPRDGLAGHALDPTWHPKPQPIFNFDRFVKEKDMQFADEIPGADGKTVGDALRTVFRVDTRTQLIVGGVREANRGIDKIQAELEADSTVDAKTKARLLAQLARIRGTLAEAVLDSPEE